ncbi:MAG: hypothetical protein JXO22_04465 [Phycisphaerae bacterium]|nr:hypothetical protein [Phycisphaerae bacterium]
MIRQTGRWLGAAISTACMVALLGCPFGTTTIPGGNDDVSDCSALFIEYFQVAQQAGAAAANCTNADNCDEFCEKFAEMEDLLEQLVDCFGDELSDIEEALARSAIEQFSAEAAELCGE